MIWTRFFKWSFLLICNFSKSGDLNKEKVIDALIVLVFESTKVTKRIDLLYFERTKFLSSVFCDLWALKLSAKYQQATF